MTQTQTEKALWSQLGEANRAAEAWRNEALACGEAEVELRAAISRHKESPKVDIWGAPRRDADEALYRALDKVEAGYDSEVSAGSEPSRADLRAVPSYGGSDPQDDAA